MATNTPHPTDDVVNKLNDIGQTLRRMEYQLMVSDRRTTSQFYLAFGLAGVLAAHALKDISPIGALIIFIFAFGLIGAAGLRYLFRKTGG